MPVQPTIIIDGIFFQIINTGIARVWRSLLSHWSKTTLAPHIVVIDRAGSAPRYNNFTYIQAPLFRPENMEEDRAFLQNVCDHFSAGVFISTYYTLPLRTPTVILVYDMIPEVRGENLRNLWWQCKHLCIGHARSYVCISNNTAADLRRFFPDIPAESISVAYPGVATVFAPASLDAMEAFRSKYGLRRPYFLTIGMRGGYKGGQSTFAAYQQLVNQDQLEIVCVGGPPILEPEIAGRAPNAKVHMLLLPDEEMPVAYSGALALAYPSEYEGFGLPILEAMACGCPVITCRNSSIPEVAGDAVLYVNAKDPTEFAAAMRQVQNPAARSALIQAGLARAKLFTWEGMANTLSQNLLSIATAASKKMNITVGQSHTL